MTRIVGGMARGVRLKVPDAGTRPTSDRAREAVFSSVESIRGSWSGACVLDLYAGTGAFGLEAASRGARRVDLVESSREAVRVIEQNRTAVAASAPQAEVGVHQVTAERWIERRVGRRAAGADDSDERYDVVFCDPPYATTDAAVHEVLSALVRSEGLAYGGLVIVERGTRDAAWTFDEPLQRQWDRRYGEAHVWIGGLPELATASDSVAHVLRVVCPGSFDPVTNGHVDIIERASGLADQVFVAVMVNQNKRGLFGVEQRIDLLAASLSHLDNASIETFSGLLVDYCQAKQARAIVKGLRAVGDFDYELQMAQMNHRLTGVDTLFVATNPLYSFLSSSLIKEVVAFGGDVEGLVPEPVLGPLTEALAGA